VYHVHRPEVPNEPPLTVKSTLSPWQIVVLVAVIPAGEPVGVSIVMIWLTVDVESQFPSARRNTLVVIEEFNTNGSPKPNNVPPKFGSPLYHAQEAPVYKVAEPSPQIEVGFATIEEADTDGSSIKTETVFE